MRARNIARVAGLRYVYTGNVHNTEGDTTYCPSCHAKLIERDWYEINSYRLTPDGHCPDCHAKRRTFRKTRQGIRGATHSGVD